MVGRYRLSKPTLGIVKADYLAQSVPEGAILEIPTAPAEGDRMVEVLWDGKAMLMFVRDLTERANKLVQPRERVTVEE